MRSWTFMASPVARDVAVRLLQEQDIAIAMELSAEAGWNQTPDDWRTLLQLAPDGCFGIDADGRLVSTATLVCYGRKLASIGMVLPTAAYRRRGFARSLLEHCTARADQLGVESLKLDATDQGQPLYESLGFRVEQPVERWWRAGRRSKGHTLPSRYSAGSDQQAYLADRSQLLRVLATRGPVRANGDAFCFSRPGRKANYIGPCISPSANEARELIEQAAGVDSYWDVLPQNRTALELAIELGFQPQRHLVRMVRGRDLRGKEDWIYAIAGFELG